MCAYESVSHRLSWRERKGVSIYRCELKSKQSSALLLLQTDTKPVQMMNLEATFCMGTIDSVNCKVIELPFQNKHLSMLILLPKDMEDESTGLEKVRRERVGSTSVPPAVAEPRGWPCAGLWKGPQPRLMPHLLCGLQGFVVLSGLPPYCSKQPTFIWHFVPGTVNSLCALSHFVLTTGPGVGNSPQPFASEGTGAQRGR